MHQVRTLLEGVLEARGKVLVKLNVPGDRLDKVIDLLPSMKSPTVNELYAGAGYAVETVVPKATINVLIPALERRGGHRHHRATDLEDRPLTMKTGEVVAVRRRRRVSARCESTTARSYFFHCTAIADGTRTIEVGSDGRVRRGARASRSMGGRRPEAGVDPSA